LQGSKPSQPGSVHHLSFNASGAAEFGGLKQGKCLFSLAFILSSDLVVKSDPFFGSFMPSTSADGVMLIFSLHIGIRMSRKTTADPHPNPRRKYQ
jgi:hypothetical protein